MKIELDESICWNEQCPDFDTKQVDRCKHHCPSNGVCETQFDVSFKSDSIKPKGESPWR